MSYIFVQTVLRILPLLLCMVRAGWQGERGFVHSVCARESMMVIMKQITSEDKSPTVQYSTCWWDSDDASARLWCICLLIFANLMTMAIQLPKAQTYVKAKQKWTVPSHTRTTQQSTTQDEKHWTFFQTCLAPQWVIEQTVCVLHKRCVLVLLVCVILPTPFACYEQIS